MMKAAIILCLVAASLASTYRSILDEEFQTFKVKYGKEYKNIHEENFRQKIFIDNKLKVAQHNQKYFNGEVSYYLSINSNSDKLHSELKARNGFRMDMVKKNLRAPSFVKLDSDITIPDAIDWREKGAVTEVKDQGQCGSCWAFSSTGGLEGQHFRQTGNLVSLSESNLVDCSSDNDGCNGGLMSYAFQFIAELGGIDTEKSYPYVPEDEPCMFNATTIGAEDTGYINIPQGDEEALKQAVATIGPISIAIDASADSFMEYKGGVYSNPYCSSEALDHGVLIVGYGTTPDTNEDYWIVKNSWGADWGMDGYILMARNKDNMCGIASMALYPTV